MSLFFTQCIDYESHAILIRKVIVRDVRVSRRYRQNSWSSLLLRRVVRWFVTNVSEDRTSTLKMEAVRHSETWISIHQTKRRNKPENHEFRTCKCSYTWESNLQQRKFKLLGSVEGVYSPVATIPLRPRCQ